VAASTMLPLALVAMALVYRRFMVAAGGKAAAAVPIEEDGR
jgi:hypothetical protein